MTSYPMISKCLGAPSGMSSTLHSVTSCSIGEANPVGALRICGSRGLSTQERREPISGGVRRRDCRRGSRPDPQDDPIHAMDVHLRFGWQVLVRDCLPEFASMGHVAFLPGPDRFLHNRRQSSHLTDDRGPVSNLLNFVHGEEPNMPCPGVLTSIMISTTPTMNRRRAIGSTLNPRPIKARRRTMTPAISAPCPGADIPKITR